MPLIQVGHSRLSGYEQVQHWHDPKYSALLQDKVVHSLSLRETLVHDLSLQIYL